MARIELAPGVFDDFERILGHLDRHGSAGGPSRVEAILQAFDLLAHCQLVGRPVRGGLRELVIGTGARGYVALYRHLADLDEVLVLAIRAQRESEGPSSAGAD
ncbi:MAG: type II toxin-antitoxin system RelE/ParE family toxin [Pseudomonadota bacterium]